MPLRKDQYTIDIPGASDIFALPIPALANKELKRQRYLRMKTSQTAMPEFLQWMPQVINKLDDAQDLLWTGLVLAKPLLRRLPSRFIPYLGWALLANDLLNLGTFLLGTMSGGVIPKRSFREAVTSLPFKRNGRLTRGVRFLGKTRWLPFALQAGQALHSVTGYGLRLGAVMGCVTDSFWALLRPTTNDQIVVRAPPEADPLSKAARYLSQPIIQYLPGRFISNEDHELLIAADNIAIGLLGENFDVAKFDTRVDRFAEINTPVFLPWEGTSLELLDELDVDLRVIDRPPGFLKWRYRKYGSHVRRSSSTARDYEVERRRHYTRRKERGQYMQNVYAEAGYDVWRSLTGLDEPFEPVLNWLQVYMLTAIELNVFPPPDTPSYKLGWWLSLAYDMTQELGWDYPSVGILRQAADEKMGGWEQRPV